MAAAPPPAKRRPPPLLLPDFDEEQLSGSFLAADADIRRLVLNHNGRVVVHALQPDARSQVVCHERLRLSEGEWIEQAHAGSVVVALTSLWAHWINPARGPLFRPQVTSQRLPVEANHTGDLSMCILDDVALTVALFQASTGRLWHGAPTVRRDASPWSEPISVVVGHAPTHRRTIERIDNDTVLIVTRGLRTFTVVDLPSSSLRHIDVPGPVHAVVFVPAGPIGRIVVRHGEHVSCWTLVPPPGGGSALAAIPRAPDGWQQPLGQPGGAGGKFLSRAPLVYHEHGLPHPMQLDLIVPDVGPETDSADGESEDDSDDWDEPEVFAGPSVHRLQRALPTSGCNLTACAGVPVGDNDVVMCAFPPNRLTQPTLYAVMDVADQERCVHLRKCQGGRR
jgi:hypothetical protein